MEFRAGVWFYGTPEQFLCHIKQALAALDRMGLFNEIKTAFKSRTKCRDVMATIEQEIATHQSSNDATAKLAIAALQGSLAAETAKSKKALEASREASEKLFAMYANLLSTEKRMAWDNIVLKNIGVTNWSDLKGVRQKKARRKSVKSFKDCVKHHLLTVFPPDAAEQERDYLTRNVRKPSRLTIRAFFNRVEQLNSYIKLLPSIYDSAKASAFTKPAQPFSEPELAGLLLKMCPDTWQNQYDLSQEHVPQDLTKLLLVLENIEKASIGSTVPAKSPSSNGNGSGQGSEKRKMNSSSDRIPKKKKKTSEKHCVLCQKHGGSPGTHNTNDCNKYEKDGRVKPEWGKKPSAKPSGKKRPDANSFAQLKDEIADLKKALKSKSKSRSRKKRRYDSDTSSDSE